MKVFNNAGGNMDIIGSIKRMNCALDSGRKDRAVVSAHGNLFYHVPV